MNKSHTPDRSLLGLRKIACFTTSIATTFCYLNLWSTSFIFKWFSSWPSQSWGSPLVFMMLVSPNPVNYLLYNYDFLPTFALVWFLRLYVRDPSSVFTKCIIHGHFICIPWTPHLERNIPSSIKPPRLASLLFSCNFLPFLALGSQGIMGNINWCWLWIGYVEMTDIH